HHVPRPSAPARRLRPHDRANSLSAARSSVLAADLRLAGLRPLPALSGAQPLPRLLARNLGRPLALGDRRALAADQAGRDQGNQRGIPAALTLSLPAFANDRKIDGDRRPRQRKRNPVIASTSARRSRPYGPSHRRAIQPEIGYGIRGD